jgi:hypothetical protein
LERGRRDDCFRSDKTSDAGVLEKVIEANEQGYYEGSLEQFVELFRGKAVGLTAEEEVRLREKLKREFALQDLTKKQVGRA